MKNHSSEFSRPAALHNHLKGVSKYYQRFFQFADGQRIEVHFVPSTKETREMPQLESFTLMRNLMQNDGVYIFDDFEALQPAVHEASHLISLKLFYGKAEYYTPKNTVIWFLRNLLSESFANTVEHLILSLDSENRKLFNFLIYRYTDRESENWLKKKCESEGIPGMARTLFAYFFVANLKILDAALNETDLLAIEKHLEVRVKSPEDRTRLSGMVIQNRSPIRVKVQNQFYESFGFPRLGYTFASKELEKILQMDPSFKAAFDQLSEFFDEIFTHE